VHTPKRVPLKGVRYIAAGAAHTLAVTDDSCYSWGHGQYGALGHGEQPCAGMAAIQPVQQHHRMQL
jgi:alpha-tubulin suppressor-like RCC1 family protein